MCYKVLSFSLWGDIKRYTIGAIRNAELAKKFYPDFECWFYIHKESVPEYIIKKLTTMDNVKIIYKSGNLNIVKPMCWRFEPIINKQVDIMMPRDTDTRILLREKLAVDEWLESGKILHIMRDHKKHHNVKIFGGMFGIKQSNIPWKEIINSVPQMNKSRGYDLTVLNKIFKYIGNDLIMIHSTARNYPGEIAKDFPIPYDSNYNFVGCYVYEDESRCEQHHKELM
jgi:protein O-GlcNAc transferase